MTLATLSIIALTAGATAQAAKPVKHRINETTVALWNCQDRLVANGLLKQRTDLKPPSKHAGQAYKKWVLGKRVERLVGCRKVLAEVKRQWNWQAWLPAHWQRVAQCETQTNWQHSNSSYQGAFGFAISSWDGYKLPGYPDEAWQATPWQQYKVALEIYNRFGMSGWGCKG